MLNDNMGMQLTRSRIWELLWDKWPVSSLKKKKQETNQQQNKTKHGEKMAEE